ncbi:MAG: biotin/lipoyl-binding protein, partial [Hyphomicrobiales bacterium]|nr:biotin/lipoyl-binding protein [Hyphomicrobiales bacterium]
MKPAERRRPRVWAALISLAIIVGAVAFADYTWERLALTPSTDNASIDADVVHVAAAVGGRIIDIPVEENGRVAKGDLLFQIDPIPYRDAVEQAEADLALAKAALGTQQRLVSTQRSTAQVAADQVKRATDNLDLATRT